MDHVIDYILDYMEYDAEIFRKEWTSGEYSKLAECPTYETIKAYCDAIGALNRMDGDYGEYTPEYFAERS